MKIFQTNYFHDLEEGFLEKGITLPPELYPVNTFNIFVIFCRVFVILKVLLWDVNKMKSTDWPFQLFLTHHNTTALGPICLLYFKYLMWKKGQTVKFLIEKEIGPKKSCSIANWPFLFSYLKKKKIRLVFWVKKCRFTLFSQHHRFNYSHHPYSRSFKFSTWKLAIYCCCTF